MTTGVIPYFTPIDLNKNELRNVRAQNLASAPSSPVVGQFYWDTGLAKFMVYNGSAFVALSDVAAGSITDVQVASANKDGLAAVPSLRTLGTGAQQAAAGNDARIVNAVQTSTKNAANGVAGLDASSHVLPANLGSGTANNTVFLRGDATYAQITDATVSSSAAIALSKLAVNPLARANHTGSQTASTISDLATVVQAYRLDQFAAPTAAVAFNNQKITGLAAGTATTDAVNLQQLQDAKNGMDRKDSVRVGVGTNVNLASPGATLDGVTMVNGDSFLAVAQTTGSQNGLYTWNGASSAATRRLDADVSSEVTAGLTTVVEEGTYADKRAILATNNPITLGTTSLNFVFESTGETIVAGAGLTRTSSTLDVGSGTGITVNADNIQLDTSIAARWKVFTIGDGTSTSYAVVHNLSNQFVIAEVFEISSNQRVVTDVIQTSGSVVTINTSSPLASNAYRVVVVG